MERPRFNEFLKLDHHLFEFVAVRNRTKRVAMMRPRAGTPLPAIGSFDASFDSVPKKRLRLRDR
jgi:hypothetical protein